MLDLLPAGSTGSLDRGFDSGLILRLEVFSGGARYVSTCPVRSQKVRRTMYSARLLQ